MEIVFPNLRMYSHVNVEIIFVRQYKGMDIQMYVCLSVAM